MSFIITGFTRKDLKEMGEYRKHRGECSQCDRIAEERDRIGDLLAAAQAALTELDYRELRSDKCGAYEMLRAAIARAKGV